MIIGFTGKRGVGKSEAAAILERKGFVRSHIFAGGKAAAEAYFRHIGASVEQAHEMVHGRLRDRPSSLLPNHETPRYFLERLGSFMGVDLGPDWTMGTELSRIKRDRPFANVVFESVAYEADVLRGAGGVVVKILRPNVDGPVGLNTDAAVDSIVADIEIVNDGTIADLEQEVLRLI